MTTSPNLNPDSTFNNDFEATFKTADSDAARPQIVIATAMPMEAAPFLEVLAAQEGFKQTTQAGLDVAVGTIAGKRVVVVTTGIGLVNAAYAATVMCSRYQPKFYLCAGTTGGLAASTRVRDVCAGTDYTYSRADATMFDYEPGQVPGMPATYPAGQTLLAAAHSLEVPGLTFGQVASSDAFITTETVENMRTTFPRAIGADMESTAAAQVCAKTGVEFLSLRGISDLCGPQAGDDFHVDGSEAAQVSANAVQALLSALPCGY